MQPAIEAIAGSNASLARLTPAAIGASANEASALNHVGVGGLAAVQGGEDRLHSRALDLGCVEVVDDHLVDLLLPLVVGVGPLFRAEVLLQVLCDEQQTNGNIIWRGYMEGFAMQALN